MKKVFLLKSIVWCVWIGAWAQTRHASAPALHSPEIQSPNCTHLAVESFLYPAGQSLHQQTGGSGWQNPWQVQNQNTDVPGYQTGGSGQSLSYGALLTSGGHGSGGRAYLTAGRRLNTSPDGPFAAYVTASEQAIGSLAVGQSLWVSALLQKNKANDDDVSIDLHSGNIVTCPHCPGTQRIGMGYYGAASNVNGQRRWSLHFDGQVVPTDVTLTTGQPALLVLHIRFDAQGARVELFVNPQQLGNAGPGAPALSLQSAENVLLRSLAFYAGPNPGDGATDEIRFAESYACVAPDPGVSVNQPPVASATATPADGEAPLAVLFDGSASFDPEGAPLDYTWNFGDGSQSASGPTAQHTYAHGGGVYQATLTVSDPDGATGAITLPIVVRRPGQPLPCLTAMTLERAARCDGGGGALRVHPAPGCNIQLSRDGIPVTPTSGSFFDNLNAGTYQLQASGPYGCSDQFQLHVFVDSASCPGWTPPACAMRIGTNLNGIADWSPQRPFRNFLKNTRYEPIPYANDCNCWSFNNPSDVLAAMQFDENGYPLFVPQNLAQGAVRLRYFVSASGANMPPGHTYVLRYDGVGTVTPQGPVSNVSSAPGRIQFNLAGDGTFWFHIEQSQAGNHVRNIRVTRLEDEFADLDNQPFYETFLERIAPFQVLRLMDMMSANNNTARVWTDRAKPGYFSYGGPNGAPYETLIQLANQTQRDIWVCVPHQADDDYIRQMAEMFRDGLDKDRVVWLEYSNEVWNWIFEQAQYNIQNNPLNLMYGRAIAEKARNVFNIWHEAFGDEACRVKRVLGIQAGFNYLNEHIVSHLRQDEWDYGSPTHYFGLDHGESGSPRLDLLGADATVEDIIQNAQNNIGNFFPRIRQDYRNIQLLGKEVVTYEGGQHFVGNVFGIPYPYQQAMWDAQNTQLMYDLYQSMLDSIRLIGCRLAVNFSLAGPQESVYGSWGVLDHIDLPGPFALTAPKYQVHLDNMPSQTCIEQIKKEELYCVATTAVRPPIGPTVAPPGIYPNPASDFVRIDMPRQGLAQIWGADGRLRMQQTLPAGEHTLRLELPPGLYFLRVTLDNGAAYTHKLALLSP
ncbi:MAG: PKD domain-containing protein [Saprospiraceae bacterium]